MAELDVLQSALEGSLLNQSRVLPDHVVVRHTAADSRLPGWETQPQKEIANVRQALLVNASRRGKLDLLWGEPLLPQKRGVPPTL